MAESTHTSSTMCDLKSGIGRGHKLWCAEISAGDGETFDPGFDKIHAVSLIAEEDTAIDADTGWVAFSESGGTVTLQTAKIGAYGAVGADIPVWAIIVGTMR